MATFSNQELKSLWSDLVRATCYLTGATLDEDAGLRDIHNALLSYFGLTRANTPKTPGDYLRGISVMASYRYTGSFNAESAQLTLRQIVNYLSNTSDCNHPSTIFKYRYLNSTSHEVIEACEYCGAEFETYSEDHYDYYSPDCICNAVPCAIWHNGECGPECSGRYYMTQEDADRCDYCTSGPVCSYPGCSNLCPESNSTDWGYDGVVRYYCCDEHYNQLCDTHGIYYGPEGTECPYCMSGTLANPIIANLDTTYQANYIFGEDEDNKWIWYTFTPPESTTYEITGTDNGDADIRIWAYEPTEPTDTDNAIYTNSDGMFPDFTIGLDAGTTYWICVKQYAAGQEDIWSIGYYCEYCGGRHYENECPNRCSYCGDSSCTCVTSWCSQEERYTKWHLIDSFTNQYMCNNCDWVKTIL